MDKLIKIIRIEDKDYFLGCTFYITENYRVYAYNEELLFFEHPTYSHNIKALQNHIKGLINNDFSIKQGLERHQNEIDKFNKMIEEYNEIMGECKLC